MKKKITSLVLAALMIAGTISFRSFAAMDNGTVVIGNKAFDLNYANDQAHNLEIGNAIAYGGVVYVKNFDGNWTNNTTGLAVNTSVIPAVVYTNAAGKINYEAGDKNDVGLAVTVNYTSARSIKIVFNKAIEDISKVAFTVQRSTTSVSMSIYWNATNTEATLTSLVNLPEGDYTVAVKNDSTDLGITKLTIGQPKVARINIISTKLSIAGMFGSITTPQRGYATYNTFDQYGNDITNSYLSNSLNFQTGVGTVTARNGVLTIVPNMNLMLFASVVIIGYDSTYGTSVSATLATSTALGTLSNITMSSLTNVYNDELTVGDTSSVFYISYTATDISGNETKDYNLVKNGLILSGGNSDEISCSSPYVKVKIVHDPNDSSKAAIQVTVISTEDVVPMGSSISNFCYELLRQNLNINSYIKESSNSRYIYINVSNF